MLLFPSTYIVVFKLQLPQLPLEINMDFTVFKMRHQ